MKLALDTLPLPREADSSCRYYFWNGKTSERAMKALWKRTLAAVFKKSKVENAHAHRFRHTLATRLLGAGYTLEVMVDILGNSPDVVRKHYGKWCHERQPKIDEAMLHHFATTNAASVKFGHVTLKNP